MARILVVDDDKILRRNIKALLKRSGYNVSVACDGSAAWKLLKRNQNFDLIISDTNMPKMNGLALLQQVRADPRNAQIRFVLMSGHHTHLPDGTRLEDACAKYDATFIYKGGVDLREVVLQLLK